MADAGKVWGLSAATPSRFRAGSYDTHHSLGPSLITRTTGTSKKRTRNSGNNRPKYLVYFEALLKSTARISHRAPVTYADVVAVQSVEGLRYRISKTRMSTRAKRRIPGLVYLHARVATDSISEADLASDRRSPCTRRHFYGATGAGFVGRFRSFRGARTSKRLRVSRQLTPSLQGSTLIHLLEHVLGN